MRRLRNSFVLHAAFLFLIGLLSYHRLFSVYFLSDDFELIRPNLQWIVSGTGFFRPLPKAILVALHCLFGLEPFPFHLASFLAHCASALLVYLILARLTRNLTAALAGGALFASHYLSSEAVYWISALNALLATLFALLAVHSLLAYLQDGGRAHRTRSLFYLALGLLCNENAVVVPLLLLLLYECRPAIATRAEFPARLRALAGHFTVLAAYVLVKLPALAAAFDAGTLSLGHHVLRNLRFMLLSLFAFNPFNDLPFVYLDVKLLNAVLDRPLPALVPEFTWERFAFPLALGTAILAFCAVVLIRRGSRLRTPLLAVLLSTLPVAGLVSTHIAFGGFYRHPLRLFYFPASLFMIFAGILLDQASAWLKRRRAGGLLRLLPAIFAASLLLAETVKTGARGADWQNAGFIARTALERTSVILAAHPQARRMVAFNLPDNARGVYIFKNGFAAALKLLHPGSTVKIETASSPPAAFPARREGVLFLDFSGGLPQVVAD